MKKLMILSAVIILSTSIFAQSEKYMAVMKSNIAAIDSSLKTRQTF